MGGYNGEWVMQLSEKNASSMIAIVFFAIMSIIAVGCVLLYISWVSLHAFLANRGVPFARKFTTQRSFFQTQLGAYTVSLLMSNFLTSIAFIIDTRWIEQMRVERGRLCTGQSVLAELSDTANAFFTAVLVIHAFNTLICRRPLPGVFCAAVVICGWIVAIIVGIVPLLITDSRLGPLYGFNGLSCGISLAYPAARVLLRLIPVFLSIFVSGVFCALTFLALYGFVTVRGELKLNFNLEARRNSMTTNEMAPECRRFVSKVAKSMVWYPVAYTLLLLSPTVVDLMYIAKGHITFPLRVFADTTLAMLGFVNSLILLNAYRLLSPFLRTACPSSDDDVSDTDSDSFFVPSASPVFPHSGRLSDDVSIKNKNGRYSDNLTKVDPPVPDLPIMTPAHISPLRSSRPRTFDLIVWSPSKGAQRASTGMEATWDKLAALSSSKRSALIAEQPRSLQFSNGVDVNLSTTSLPILPHRSAVDDSQGEITPIVRPAPPPLVVNSASKSLPPLPDMTDIGNMVDTAEWQKLPVITPQRSMETIASVYSPPPFSPPTGSTIPSGSRATSIASSAAHRGLPSNPRAYKTVGLQLTHTNVHSHGPHIGLNTAEAHPTTSRTVDNLYRRPTTMDSRSGATVKGPRTTGSLGAKRPTIESPPTTLVYDPRPETLTARTVRGHLRASTGGYF